MLFERKEQAVVSSRVIAEKFGKRHGDVLSKLEGKIRNSSGRKNEIGLLEQLRGTGFPAVKYFIKNYYIDESNGETYKEYLCTRDGFSLLIMGFTGKEALDWKLKYIKAFNEMEAFIKERQSSEWMMTRKQGKLVRRSETDAIANLIKHAEKQGSANMRKQAYTIYSKLVNDLVGIERGQREKAPFKVITTITFLEDMIMNTILEEIDKDTHYKEIYKKCKANGEQIIKFAYLPKLTA